jgi:hypothetical protein
VWGADVSNLEAVHPKQPLSVEEVKGVVMWPFKTIKKGSSWPFQPFVVASAARILQVSSEQRKEAAVKTVERFVRVGARLAVEFDIAAPLFVDIARAQIVKEGGKKASDALQAAKNQEYLKVFDDSKSAEEAVGQQLSSLFGNEEIAES